MSNYRLLQVVAGAQFGSEAKGHVTQRLLRKSEVDMRINVRVAGPNAGHTAYDDAGVKFAFRQVPVGAVTFDDTVCVIAAGSEVDPEVLVKEIDLCDREGHPLAGRLFVDGEATIITDQDIAHETRLVEGIGSTGKGIGAARARRLTRRAHRVKDDAFLMQVLADCGVLVTDTARWMNERVIMSPDSIQIVVEGTQGYGLGLHAGHYPQVTSSDCRAIDFLAMAGLQPWQNYRFTEFEIWLVARVYPIRVAGNSGPLHQETTWEELGLPEERTTVTQKVRRVGQWDHNLVEAAVLANGGAPVVRVALTMIDQAVPDVANDNSLDVVTHSQVRDWIEQVEACGAPVAMITTGPTTGVWV